MTLTNQSEVPMPAGLGWHPYFAKRPGSHLRFAADGRIAYHRDYWDAAEEVYEKVPLLGGLLRRIKRRLQV